METLFYALFSSYVGSWANEKNMDVIWEKEALGESRGRAPPPGKESLWWCEEVKATIVVEGVL